MTKAEIRRLKAIADDLGVTLVPQFNVFGHASMSRSQSGKHAVLDLNRAYQPLFEPHHGWNWCLSNPEAQRVVDGLVVEMHEAFGNPPYFHIGCDEAHPPSCPTCRAQDYVGLIASNITRVATLLEKRGARAMMWHDMLLKQGAWGRFYANAKNGEEKMLGVLPKSIVICDWFYNEGVSPEGYPTFAHFRKAGYDVLCSPWESVMGTAAQAKAAQAAGALGLLGTTWHHVYKRAIANQFVPTTAGAWGTEADSYGFIDHWRIDELALHGGEAALRHFVRDSVSADEAQVVAGGHGVGGAEGHRERLPRGDVRPGLVRRVDADGDLVLQRDSAPGGVHHVRRPVPVVRADHQHGHREHPVLHSKVLLHGVSLLASVRPSAPQMGARRVGLGMTLSLTVIPACLPAAKANDSLPWRHQPSHHRPRRATRLLCKAHDSEARIGLYS